MAMAPPPGFGSGQDAKRRGRALLGATEDTDLDSAGIKSGPGFVHQNRQDTAPAAMPPAPPPLAPPSGAAQELTAEPGVRFTAPMGQDLERQGLAVEGRGDDARVVDIGAGPSELPADVGEELPDSREGVARIMPEGRPVLQSEIDPQESPDEAAEKALRLEEFRDTVEGGSASRLQPLDESVFTDQAVQGEEAGDRGWTGRGGWQYEFNENRDTGVPTITATDPSRQGAVFTVRVDQPAPSGGRYAGQNMWQRIWAEQIGLDNARTGRGPAITEGMSTSEYESAMQQIMESRGQTYVPLGGSRRTGAGPGAGPSIQPDNIPETYQQASPSSEDISTAIQDVDQLIYNDEYENALQAQPLLDMLEEADDDPDSGVALPDALLDIPNRVLYRLYNASGERRDTQIAIANEIENRFSNQQAQGIPGSLSDYPVPEAMPASDFDNPPESDVTSEASQPASDFDNPPESDVTSEPQQSEVPYETAWAGDAVSDLTQWYSSPEGGNRYMGQQEGATHTLQELLDGMSRDNLISWLQSSYDEQTLSERSRVIFDNIELVELRQLPDSMTDYFMTANAENDGTFESFYRKLRQGVRGGPASATPASATPASATPGARGAQGAPRDVPGEPVGLPTEGDSIPASDTLPRVVDRGGGGQMEPVGRDQDAAFRDFLESAPEGSVVDNYPVSDPPFEPIVQGASEIGAQPTTTGVAAGLIQNTLDRILGGKTLAALNESELNVLLQQPLKNLGGQEGRALIEARLAEVQG
jgi:hypothetical protein